MLLTIDQVTQKIANGNVLMIAGDQSVLSVLPKGNWIGGSIPYFISEEGGTFSKEKVYVTEIDRTLFKKLKVNTYNEKSIPLIAKEAYENSLTFLILPAASKVLVEYAKNSPGYDQMFTRPIVGWVSGMALNEIGKTQATVVNGLTGESFTDKAVALHCELPEEKIAKIGIINIFSQGQGDSLEFETEGFDVQECLVNGKKTDFAQYLTNNQIDTQLPMVADFSGAMVNVSFQSVDTEKNIVHLYAPVFKNMVYKIAAPVGDYSTAFDQALKALSERQLLFSCNCILNYLYGSLEGKKTGNATGPVTFGEVAYQLLNQTLVYVEI